MMLRLAFCLMLLCEGCVASQPESARTTAAFEVPLPTASDRAEFLDLLQKEAVKNGYHVDSASEAELAQLSTVSPTTFRAAVWRGANDDEVVASAMDFEDHPGRVWLSFSQGEDPASVRRFRDELMPLLKARWSGTASLPIMPSGAIPLPYDLVRTPSGYQVKPEAAYRYQAIEAGHQGS